MLRVPLFSLRGRTLTIEINGRDGLYPPAGSGQSVLLIRQRGETTELAADVRVVTRSRSRAIGGGLLVMAPPSAAIEQLADQVIGWENVFYGGKPIRCRRGLVIELLREKHIRAQVEQTIAQARTLGVL